MIKELINYSFDIDIEFEANPKPDKITWEMQVEKGRNSQTVKEGKSKRGYEALDIEEDVSKHIFWYFRFHNFCGLEFFGFILFY